MNVSSRKVRLATSYSSDSVFGADKTLGTGVLPIQTEVLIVGASMAGLGLATELAVRDIDVLVTDSGQFASSPLSNGLGHMYAGFGSDAVMPDSHSEAAKIFEAGKAAVKWTQRVIDEFDIDCHFTPGEPALLDPAVYSAGLRRLALKHGAQISADTRAVGINPHSEGGFEVRTSKGRVAAEQVVVADGADLASLLPKAEVDLKHLTWTYLATEPLPKGLDLDLHSEARLTRDRRLLVGAPFGGDVEAARDKLARQMFEDFPSLLTASTDGESIRVSNSWQASMMCSIDGIPRAGTHAGVYYIVAGSERDLARMAWLGSRTGRWICGEDQPVLSGLERQPVLARVMAKLADLRS